MAAIILDIHARAAVGLWHGRLAECPMQPHQVAIPCEASADVNDPDWLALLDDPAALLVAHRERVRDRISAWRDAQEQGAITFTHAGRTWDGGLAVRTRLKPVAGLPALPPGFFWTDAHDNDVPLTVAEVQALDAAHEQALIERGWAIHARQRAMKAEIEALDAAGLAAYVIGWPEP